MLLLSLLLGACSGCSHGEPTTPEDCVGIGSTKDRDECYLAVAPAVFKKDAAAGVQLVEKDITDPVTRDFAWYRITEKVDPASNKYCDRIQDQTLAERCRTIVSRPHLHRVLTGQDATPSGMKNAPDHSKPVNEVLPTRPQENPPGTPAP